MRVRPRDACHKAFRFWITLTSLSLQTIGARKTKLSSTWRGLFFRLSWRNAKNFPFLMSRGLSQYFANMTNYSQRLDLTVNGPAKQFLKRKFQEWYAREIAKQVDSNDVNNKLSVMKPIHARWLVGLYDHLRNKPEVIRKGLEMAEIVEAVTKELEPEDPFEDLVADH